MELRASGRSGRRKFSFRPIPPLFMFPTLVITISIKYESLRMSHKHVPAYLPGDRIAMFPIFSEVQFFSFLE